MTAFAVVPSQLRTPASDCAAVARALAATGSRLLADGPPDTGDAVSTERIRVALADLAAAVDRLAREAERDAEVLRAACASYALVDQRVLAQALR